MKNESPFEEQFKELLEENALLKKEILTFEEATKYLGLSKSNLYKRTSLNQIPFYKPGGKLIYFRKTDLDDFMLRNRQSTVDEIRENAANFKLNDRRSKS